MKTTGRNFRSRRSSHSAATKCQTAAAAVSAPPAIQIRDAATENGPSNR